MKPSPLELFRAASKVRGPLALIAMSIILVYLILWSILSLDIFSNIGGESTFLLIDSTVGKLFWFVLAVSLLAAFCYVAPMIWTPKNTSRLTEDQQEQRQTLRKILGDIVPRIRVIINIPQISDTEFQEARHLHQNLESMHPIFINNESVAQAITRIGNIVGVIAFNNFPSERPARRAPTIHLFDAFEKDVETLKAALKSFDETKGDT